MSSRLLGVEDEELAVLLVLRVEREAEEAFLVRVVVVGDPVLDVEEDLGQALRVVGEDVDDAVLGGDEVRLSRRRRGSARAAGAGPMPLSFSASQPAH